MIAALPRALPPAILLFVVLSSCTSDDPPDDTKPIEARFNPSKPSPGPNDVATAQGDLSGDMVTVRVTVTGVSGIHSADFRVFWNASRAKWIGWSEGTLLDKDGASTSFTVQEIGIGQLRVEARRTGTTDPVDAVGTEELLDLEFRLLKKGDAPLNFPTPVPGFPRALRDPTMTDLPGLTWWGGQLVGR
jgi:hypothetical protein